MTFYEESVHVPLLMRLPGRIPAGRVIRDVVSTMDIFATTLDYLGVAAPKTESQSLRGLIEGKGTTADFRVSEWAGAQVPNFMVRTRDWKLIMGKNPANRSQDALFDLKNDPDEITNLLGEESLRTRYRKQGEELKERLLTWLKNNGNPALETVRARKL
jgi:arylsulfatase A-like enzyme